MGLWVGEKDTDTVCVVLVVEDWDTVEELRAEGELRFRAMRRVALAVMDTVTVPERVNWEADWEVEMVGVAVELAVVIVTVPGLIMLRFHYRHNHWRLLEKSYRFLNINYLMLKCSIH